MKTVYIGGMPVRFWQAGERDTNINYAVVKISDNYESYYTTHTIDNLVDFEDICRAYIRGDGPGGGTVTITVLTSKSRRYPTGSTWWLEWDEDGEFSLSRAGAIIAPNKKGERADV